MRKITHFLLIMALTLLPMEFSLAHEMGQDQARGEIHMQHWSHALEQYMAEDVGHQSCDSKTTCTDCVYCSPAMSLAAEIDIDLSAAAQPQTLLAFFTSIEQSTAFRPPRRL